MLRPTKPSRQNSKSYSQTHRPMIAKFGLGLICIGISTASAQEVGREDTSCAALIESHAIFKPVQAVCMDSLGTLHPASRVTGAEVIDTSVNGELFRCLSGSHLQITIGSSYDGQPTFADEITFSCRLGEALTHQDSGSLICAPAVPQRNGYERSLLRRHGPGIKLLPVPVTQEICVSE